MTEAAASNPSGGRIGGWAVRGPVRLLTDERLSRRAAAGDRSAFAEIFRRYHQDLYRFCLATAGDPQDAQEAMQNTMVKVMRALPGEEREIKLKPWLYRIARNEAVETVRRRRDSTELGAELAAASMEIADTAAARERLRALFADLRELPERQRAALVMRELAGLDFEEIGAAFETTPAVARQTLYEARQSLRQMEKGREMGCGTVRHALSDDDGRVLRRRDVRAHLRGCPECRAFHADIAERRLEFKAIAPLPLAASAGLLQSLLGGQAGGVGAGLTAGSGTASGAGTTGGAGVASTIGVGTGKVVATSALVKSAATAAVVAAVGVTAADRGGVLDLPVVETGASPAAREEQGGPSGSTSGGHEGSGGTTPEAWRAPPGAEPGSRWTEARSRNDAVADADNAAKRETGQTERAANPRTPRAEQATGKSLGNAKRDQAQAGGSGQPQGKGPSEAANQGQQTAASHKSPRAATAPGPSGKPKPAPAEPPKAKKPPAVESTLAPPPPAAKGGASPPNGKGKGAPAEPPGS